MTMNSVIRNIQLVAVIFILVGTVLAFGFEVNEMYKAERVTLADLLLMFIYIEVIGMIGVFWASKTIRITYPVLIAITALARLIILQDKDSASINLIYQGGVDQSLVLWLSYDGVGRQIRNGLNFTERGFGVRGALGCSDRGNTAMAHLKPRDIDWEKIFGYEGVRWFHTGGIYAAVSENSPLVNKEAMKVAKRYGTVISYDLNYRESLWKGIGGKKKAQQVNREIAPYVDVMLGNEEDFISSLGFTVDNTDENFSKLDVTNFKRMIKQVVHTFPNFKVVVVAETRANAINGLGIEYMCGGIDPSGVPPYLLL